VVTAAQVWQALEGVSDPEYPLSIVDLGLVYDVRVHEGAVQVDVTLTSIGCPAIDMITSDVRIAVAAVPGVSDVQIEVVWSPPWTKDRITERGWKVLGMYGVAS
jgi:phenylacetate-CoA oxygenase PaaJ subunit